MTQSALTAAAKVLAEAAGPLHVTEITRRMLSQGLWASSGKTPSATVAAQLAVHIKRKSTESRFERTAPSTYRLREMVSGTNEPADLAKSDHKADGPMSFTDAAEAVLDRYAHQKPMNYRRIAVQALANKWITTSGLTPEATLYASLITEIGRATKKGKQPRFTRQPKGMFGLSKWSATKLENQIEEHNRAVKQQIRQRLGEMKWEDFEKLIGHLLGQLGFADIEVTSKGGDGGIDVRGTLVVADVVRTRMAVQVKRWKHNVQAPTIQMVRGALGTHDQGLIITTSDFGSGARKEASRTNAVPVALMNGDQLVDLMVEQNLGAKRAPFDLLELAPESDPFGLSDAPPGADGPA